MAHTMLVVLVKENTNNVKVASQLVITQIIADIMTLASSIKRNRMEFINLTFKIKTCERS